MRGRWSDARHEFLRARGVLGTTGRYDRQTVDYYLAACAVGAGRPRGRGGAPQLRAAVARFGLRQRRAFLAGVVVLHAGRLRRRGPRVRRSRLRGALAAPQGAVRHPYGLCGLRVGAPRRGLLSFRPHRLRQRVCRPCALLQILYRLRRRPLGRARGVAQLASGSAYAPLVPYYLLQLEFADGNYPYVTAHGEALAAGAVPHHRVGIYRIPAESWYRLGEYDKTVSCLDAYLRDGGEPGRDEHYPEGYAPFTARRAMPRPKPRCAALRGRTTPLTQNASLPPGRLFQAPRRQARGHAGVRHGGRTDVRPRHRRGCALQLRKTPVRAGRRRGSTRPSTCSGAIWSAIPIRRVRTRPANCLVAAYYNSCDYDAAYAAIKACPLPDANLRAALQKIAYFRGLEAYGRGDRATAKRLLAESAAVGVSPKYNALALFWQGEIAYAEQDYPWLHRVSRPTCGVRRARPRSILSRGTTWLRPLRAGAARSRGCRLPQVPRAPYPLRRVPCRCAQPRRRCPVRRAGLCRGPWPATTRPRPGAAPERHYARYQRAVTLGLLHRTEEKIAALERIVKAGEGEYADDAAYELGRTYIAGERYAEGARVLGTLHGRSSPFAAPCPGPLGAGARILNLGDRERSLRCYERAVAAAPHSAEAKGAMEGIRDIYVSQGRRRRLLRLRREDGTRKPTCRPWRATRSPSPPHGSSTLTAAMPRRRGR